MNELIISIVNVCIVPILGVLTTYACMWFRSKIAEINDTNMRNFLMSSLEELNQAVNTAVGKVSQTYVNSLKKNGEFNVKEQQKALQDAYNTTLSILSNGTIEFLENQLTKEGFQEMITSKIEELVGLNKQFNNQNFITDTATIKTDSEINK